MRMAFSIDRAPRSGCAKSTLDHEKFPDFSLSLWQAEQVRAIKACWEAVVEKVSAVCPAAGPTNQTAAPTKMKIFRRSSGLIISARAGASQRNTLNVKELSELRLRFKYM
jgi:hypothetical protein